MSCVQPSMHQRQIAEMDRAKVDAFPVGDHRVRVGEMNRGLRVSLPDPRLALTTLRKTIPTTERSGKPVLEGGGEVPGTAPRCHPYATDVPRPSLAAGRTQFSGRERYRHS